jgi:DinB superfamily
MDEVMVVLADTPQQIATLTAELEPAQLRGAPAAGEWSALDVLAHLRTCADVWGRCISRIVHEERPTIQAVNPRTWIRETRYAEIGFRDSLRSFAAQRADLLAVLERLPPRGWTRVATVAGAGRPLERSVLFYADWMARHERPHVKQVGRIVEVARSRRLAR